MRLPKKVPARRTLRQRNATLTSNSPRAHLMSLPTELRVEIYRHVVHPCAMQKVFLTCCDFHKWDCPGLDDRNIWCTDQFDEFETCIRDRSKLLRVNSTVRAEVETFLMKKWEFSFCIPHLPHAAAAQEQNKRHEMLTGPLADDWDLLYVPSPGWEERFPLDDMIGCTTKVNLLMDVRARRDLDQWELQLRHWEFVDTCQYLVHILQRAENVRHLHVFVRMYGDTSEDVVRLEAMIPMLLSPFEILRDEVKLKIDVQFESIRRNLLLRLGEDHTTHVKRLESSARQKHFPALVKRLDEKWYTLRDWAENYFGYRVLGNTFESCFASLADHGGSEEELQENLRAAWHAQHVGDAEVFTQAKDKIKDMWKKHSERALKAISDL